MRLIGLVDTIKVMNKLIFGLVLVLTALVVAPSLGLANQPARAAGCVKLASPIDPAIKCVPDDPGTGGPIMFYLRLVIKFISGLFGLMIVLMVIVGGLQYMTSAGSPSAVESAKKRLANAALGLVLFILLFGIVNYLIPGGVFT